jgi:hypothetical protein
MAGIFSMIGFYLNLNIITVAKRSDGSPSSRPSCHLYGGDLCPHPSNHQPGSTYHRRLHMLMDGGSSQRRSCTTDSVRVSPFLSSSPPPFSSLREPSPSSTSAPPLLKSDHPLSRSRPPKARSESWSSFRVVGLRGSGGVSCAPGVGASVSAMGDGV